MAKYIEDVTKPFTTLKAIFYKRLSYWDTMRDISLTYPNIIDFNHGEKYLYGRVDESYRPMTIRPGVIRNFKDTADPKRRVGAVDYVVDAFHDMNQQFKKATMTRRIDASDRYLSNLKVFKAYENPAALYANYIRIIEEVIAADLRQRNIMLKDFRDFTNTLYLKIQQLTRRQPFTYSAFVKSRFCPMNVSGLVIEIAPEDYNNDQEKYQQFVESPNWDVYVQLCSNYGFMIDQNAPWRLVADVKSESMKIYSARTGIGDYRSLFRLYYTSTYIRYFNNFQRRLLKMYNRLKPFHISETYTCADGTIKSRIVAPEEYTLEEINTLYDEEHFLDLYFNIRLLEKESNKTEHQKKLFKNDCMNVYKSFGADTALMIFERILNLPLDYVGSYHYNDIKKKLLADAAAAEKGATVLPSSYSGGY